MTNPFIKVATKINSVQKVPGFFSSIIKFNFRSNKIGENIYHTEINEKTQTLSKTRAVQWRLYKKNYYNCRKNMARAAGSRIQSTDNYQIISLSDLGITLHIPEIKKHLLVKEGTQLVEIACIDEGTQAAEFINETNLKGRKLGTISDPLAERYVLDLAGSGALKYVCKATENKDISVEEIVEIEKQRLEDMASRIATWCQARDIIKLTVTYHDSCGAVALRIKNLPGLSAGKTDLEVAKDCALALAKKIQAQAIKIDYELDVTLAFIGDKQMCKLRPMQMHNALGTIGCMDSRVLGQNFDTLHHLNFFDVLISSDFEEGGINTKYKIDTIHSAVKNLCLSVNIAFGDSGWGEAQFSFNRPYMIVLCVTGKEQEVQAAEIIEQMDKATEHAWQEKLEYYIVRTDL